ncbi:class A beta-lactamase [Paraburkholderia hospita]|uniref:class A beta-lactamase n=1 Tax=Paraburkholderia hospita TaxID=169430 RepID=UPI000271BEE2|nr:class A beta-lactamase [Paraburkholderia hospita]EUC14375.1 Beta-lactamase [Burkholderia sp. BT03]SKC93545.1 Beta-lactamase class A [Paraburkholderia hospita]
MPFSPLRRSLLIALAAGPVIGVRAQPASSVSVNLAARGRFEKLEASSGGRLGVAALNTADGSYVGYRESERFPMCSTFKLLVVALVLKRSMAERGLLDERVRYGDADLVANSPVTKRRVGEGMTIGELSAAALQHSDNTAANLLLTAVGGPEVLNQFALSIGDEWFDLLRGEPEVNASVPGDMRDTTTPRAMMLDVQKLLLADDVLGPQQREQLKAWMLGNATGAARIRAAVPGSGWLVADKTGSGDYGTANDVAVVYPPSAAPFVIAVYFTGVTPKQTPPRDEVVAEAARIVFDAMK